MSANKVAPIGALLQINTYCNLACTHCSQSAPQITRGVRQDDLPVEQWIRIFNYIKNEGITRIRFTGGEAFLRRDIEELYFVSTSIGLEPSIVTNGISISSKHYKWLKKFRPTVVWISIYGYPASIYEAVCGRNGFFKYATDVISKLVTAEIDVGLYYPLGECTDRGVAPFLRYAYKLGVRKVRFLQVLPHGRSAKQGGMGSLPQERLGHTLNRIVNECKKYPSLEVKVSMDSGQTNVFLSKGFMVPKMRGCEAGLHRYWTIDSKGWTLACCLFLGKNKGRLLDVGVPQNLAKWRCWDRQYTMEFIGVQSEQPLVCPALMQNREREITQDFICPLTYAEPPK